MVSKQQNKISIQQDGLNGNEIPLVEWEKMQEGVEG